VGFGKFLTKKIGTTKLAKEMRNGDILLLDTDGQLNACHSCYAESVRISKQTLAAHMQVQLTCTSHI